MSNNRTEVKAFIQANIQPSMVTAVHRETIDDNFAEGAVFKKDVSSSKGGATPTADFTSVDQVVVDTGGVSTTITVIGLEDGQRSKLIVKKGAADTISFVGISGTVNGQVLGSTEVHYDVWAANGKIYLTKVNCQNDGNLVQADVAFNVGSVNNVYLRYKINNNIVKVDGAYDNFGAAADIVTITIASSRVFGYFFNPTTLPDMGAQTWAKRYPVLVRGLDNDTTELGAFGYVEDTGSGYVITIHTPNFTTTSRKMVFSFSVEIL